MANPLRINTVELIRRQGNERMIDVTVPFEFFDVVDERIAPTEPVHVLLRVDSLNDGLVVNGTIGTSWHGSCRRCAIDLAGDLCAVVDERYQQHATDPDAIEFDGEQVDLVPMVRELILLEAPATPLCREDCRGLCPTCGTDLNTGSCECMAPPASPRWAALDQLKADLHD